MLAMHGVEIAGYKKWKNNEQHGEETTSTDTNCLAENPARTGCSQGAAPAGEVGLPRRTRGPRGARKRKRTGTEKENMGDNCLETRKEPKRPRGVDNRQVARSLTTPQDTETKKTMQTELDKIFSA